MPKHILLTETHHPHLLEGLTKLPCTWTHLPHPTPENLLPVLPKAHIWILRGAIPVTESLLTHASQLQAIIRPGSGIDHIDLAALEKRGIRLFTTPHSNATSVAEYVFTALTLLTRRIWSAALDLRNGQWRRREFIGHELHTLTVGIIGFGHTGSQTAYRLAAAGVRVLAYDKYKGGFGGYGIEEAPLEKLFAEATAISFHVPLTSETRQWADRAFWEAFSHPLYVVNTARGEILSLPDLVWALQSGKVLGAALDVLPQEPPIALSPEDNTAWTYLRTHPQVLLTPHIAGLTHESERRLAEATLSLLRHLV
ncbi:MAG: NAD(P)-dependent oxidoreductase [Bacteroidota bacterium]|nr:NAD(P)-dependent oxidoreductase [Bacteroidota bacterium]